MEIRPDPPLIAVLMATYNGARYLSEQLDSLWQQTLQDFEIIVRDDGSADDTLKVLSRESARHPGRIRIIDDKFGRIGPKNSFAALLRHSRSRWVAFCDQDDSWLPGKLERQVHVLQSLEVVYGFEVPLLCCSDAIITDSNLRTTEPSYFSKHRIDIAKGRDLALPRLLFRNYAIGATTMINRALADRCRDIPGEAIMHDWWCALVACVSGHSVVLPDAQVRYRQHGANAIGSRRLVRPRSMADWRELFKRTRENSARCLRQAQTLHRATARFKGSISYEDKAVLSDYEGFAARSPFSRAMSLLRNRSFKPGLAVNGLHLYSCATTDL